jgi:hypothetical protein
VIEMHEVADQANEVNVPCAWSPDGFERRLMALDRAINFHHTGSDVQQVIETASKFERYLSSSD